MLLLTESFKWASSTSDLGLMWVNDNTGQITLNSTGSRFGGKCLQMGDVSSGISKAVALTRRLMKRPSGTTIRVALWVKLSSGWTGGDDVTNSEFLWSLKGPRHDTGDAPSLSAKFNSTGAVEVYKADTMTSNGRNLVVTGSTSLADNTWHRLEFEIVLSPTVGSVKVWVDSTLDINTSGVDTDDLTSPSNLSYLQYFALATGQFNPDAGETLLIDDVVVWDDVGGFTGEMTSKDHRIDLILPGAEGGTIEWSPSSGADNAALVDDPSSATHDGDSTYVSSSAASSIDLYNYAALSLYPDSIYAAIVKTVHSAPTGNFGCHRNIVKSGSSTGNGDKHLTIAGGYSLSEDAFHQDPATSAAWTLSGINAAEFGMERLSP